MTTAVVLLGLLVLALFAVWRWIRSLDSDRKKAIKDAINSVFERAEARGLFPRAPAFITDYARDYPALALLERSHATIREECEALLGIKDRLVDVEALGAAATPAAASTRSRGRASCSSPAASSRRTAVWHPAPRRCCGASRGSTPPSSRSSSPTST